MNVDVTSLYNKLNQPTTIGGAAIAHDARGNLTSDGTTTYGYDIDNRLVSGSGGAALTYNSVGQLWQVAKTGSATTRFLYAGSELIGEYDASNALQRRYVHGANIDEPVVWYEGADASDRRWLVADERGSVIAVTDAAGAALGVNSYDVYGKPGAGNMGRFAYTGQTFIPEVGLYHYKARFYSPDLGRFMQTDPIGYEDQMNLYAYVHNDPVNATDPDGRQATYNDPQFQRDHLSPADQAAFSRAESALTDIVPGLGDVKGITDAIQNPTPINIVAAAIGVVPAVGDLGKAALKNSDLVVRGGTNTADRFTNGSGVTTNANGTLSGVSVNSAPGASVEQLSAGIPNGQVGVTTVGDIRAAGGDVVPSPTANNPNHCTMCGITAPQAEKLFTPTIPNPDRLD